MQNREIRVIQSVQRAIDIIDFFSEHELKLTLPQISARTGLNINTARGLVNTLLANGYLEHIPDGNFYMLGPVFIPKADLVGMNDIDRLRSRVRPERIEAQKAGATVITAREELEEDLERIRNRGFSTEFDEFGVGISCIAVPILRSNGTLYGTVSIVASSSVVQDVGEQALGPMRDLAAYVREELL